MCPKLQLMRNRNVLDNGQQVDPNKRDGDK